MECFSSHAWCILICFIIVRTEKEPVWTWAHAMLGDFDESDVKSIELELLTKDEEQAVFLHMKFFFI